MSEQVQNVNSLAGLLLQRVPPHRPDAEAGLIGCCLVMDDPSEMPPLRADEFYFQKNQVIWTAIQELIESDGTTSLMAVVEHLRAADNLDLVGGPAYLALCVENGCVPSQMRGLARMVRDASKQRAMQFMAGEMIGRGLSEAEILKRLDALPGPLTEEAWDPADAWHRIVESWAQKRLKTGWPALDAMSGGFERGTFVVIGGRTSTGKTAFCTNLARRLAIQGTRVLFISLEDTDLAVTRRLIAQMTGIEVMRLRIGGLSMTGEDSEFARAEKAVVDLQSIPLNITQTHALKHLDEDSVLAAVAVSDAEVVIVDHVQKIITDGDSRQYGIERLVNRLHALAVRSGKVLVVAAQLSRLMESEKRAPRLGDLRDSGSLEQSPRQVWLLFWPSKIEEGRSPLDYVINVAKNSDGQTGEVPFNFHADTGLFMDPHGDALAEGGIDGVADGTLPF